MKHPLSEINFAEGSMLLLDKPYGITSFGLVFQIKKWVNPKPDEVPNLEGESNREKKRRIRIKIGHAGTLDPLASGLMIVCTGKWTKKIQGYMGMDKTYKGSFQLGATTPTYDRESLPENIKETAHITPENIEAIKHQFVGDLQQLPPAYSAIKQDGKALYALAREGKEVRLAPRCVTIHSLEMAYENLPEVNFTVRCSSGTYIRSLAKDIGEVLGCGAYLSSLQRTAIGDYSLDDAFSLDEMKAYFKSEAKLKVIEAKC